jgi:hypothetical protein
MKVLIIGIVCVGCGISALFLLGIGAVYSALVYMDFDHDGYRI